MIAGQLIFRIHIASWSRIQINEMKFSSLLPTKAVYTTCHFQSKRERIWKHLRDGESLVRINKFRLAFTTGFPNIKNWFSIKELSSPTKTYNSIFIFVPLFSSLQSIYTGHSRMLKSGNRISARSRTNVVFKNETQEKTKMLGKKETSELERMTISCNTNAISSHFHLWF